MVNIENYFTDGANVQAQCVMLLVKEHSENIKYFCQEKNDVRVCVGRFENGREQGYVISFLYYYDKDFHQKNYAIYEHRNSDDICILMNETRTLNTPTINEMWDGRSGKYSYDVSFKGGQFNECADYIVNDIYKFIEKVEGN